MLSFFGGKSKMGEWIYQFIPKDIATKNIVKSFLY